MSRCLTLEDCFGNPASRSHQYGWEAEEAVEQARQQLATLVGCDPWELVWTSGATESNNLAIKGFLESSVRSGEEKGHLITSAIEHNAVLDTATYMEARGYTVTRLQPSAEGILTPVDVQAALRPNTVLVSLMYINNEIGTINPVNDIAQVCADAKVALHVDAAQALGKIPIDLRESAVDMMSFSGHKIYGPKGVGALYVRFDSDIQLAAQMHGGGHEKGMRSGTLPTHQLVGFGSTASICGGRKDILAELKRLETLRKLFLDSLSGSAVEFLVNGSPNGYSGILNLAFPGVNGETLLMALSADLALSGGSACNSLKTEPSHVLLALGIREDLADSSLRFSFGRPTTEEDVLFAAERLEAVLSSLRA